MRLHTHFPRNARFVVGASSAEAMIATFPPKTVLVSLALNAPSRAANPKALPETDHAIPLSKTLHTMTQRIVTERSMVGTGPPVLAS